MAPETLSLWSPRGTMLSFYPAVWNIVLSRSFQSTLKEKARRSSLDRLDYVSRFLAMGSGYATI